MLTTNVALAELAPPIFVIDGVLDTPLQEDFSGPPLRSTTQALVVESVISRDQAVTRITPEHALVPGQQVTLVVAPWAVGAEGERWEMDDIPFVATFRVTAEADGGAAVVASWPADGAAGVPPNLAFAAIGLDGEIAAPPDTLELIAEDTGDRVAAAVSSIACAAVGLRAHQCLLLSLQQWLQPATAYTIDIGDWVDPRGGSIAMWSARFVTAMANDRTAPTVVPLPCALDEATVAIGCAFVTDAQITFRITLGEPALIRWQSSTCAPQTLAAFGAEANLTVDTLRADTLTRVAFDVTDAAGNNAHIDEALFTEPPLPTITITEVRFDPTGPEPQQEYVELFNFGEVAIDLQGYAISDDRFDDGDTIDRSVFIHPGGRALLVADDFDASDTRDVLPAPGALIVRIGTSLANGGLSNGGEPLFLRDPTGTRISEVPSIASAGAGTCLQRAHPRTRDGSPHSFVHDADRACTPGR